MHKEAVYKVNGMKCQGCVAAVKDVLGKLPGCDEARVDLQAGTAVVVGDVDPEAVVKALTAIGYPAQKASA
jgi:copper chaperone CopZ